MTPRSGRIALRQAVLAVSVLGDVDVRPVEHGVRVVGRRSVLVAWNDLAVLCGTDDPLSAPALHRLTLALRLTARAADVPRAVAAQDLAARAVLVALPAGQVDHHVDHLGPSWRRRALPGGVLDLGIGVLGMLDDPDQVVPLPSFVARAAGVDVPALWPRVLDHAERMSDLAARAHLRPGVTGAVLRPVGGCDVPALLAAGPLRAALADGDGTGLRALAVPTRSRGWFDLSRVDPAFVAAAWSLTPPAERGLARPLLVTRDEVALPRSGGDVRAVVREGSGR